MVVMVRVRVWNRVRVRVRVRFRVGVRVLIKVGVRFKVRVRVRNRLKWPFGLIGFGIVAYQLYDVILLSLI